MDRSHADDLLFAQRCAAGDEDAWERFVREYRPLLYRAADALDATGRARELADALYADLFARSLFTYFHGRSSLATWLRAVLSQRYIDALRAARRLEPLDDAAEPADTRGEAATADPERPRYLEAMQRALDAAVSALADRDRMRLACYYVQSMTLAAIGRLTGEHEATVSRHLTRTRRVIRDEVERRLREAFSDDQVAACFASVSADPGTIDITGMLGLEGESRERSSF